MLRLVIAVDGSDASLRAIDAAARLAKDAQVEAVLLNVRPGPAYHGDISPRDYERIGERERAHQEKVLDAALKHAQRIGLERAIVQAETGTPEVDVPRIADERAADLIVMGTRGLSSLGGLLLGSVAQRVVHHASVPVLLVK
jgi:nucleotide-binding universal stress UspA family protein